MTISLRDVNDRTPVFQFHDYQSEVSEGSPVGTTIITLLATDMDAAENTAVWPFLIAVSGRKTTGSSVLISPFLSLKSVRKQLYLVRGTKRGLGNCSCHFDFRYLRLTSWLMLFADCYVIEFLNQMYIFLLIPNEFFRFCFCFFFTVAVQYHQWRLVRKNEYKYSKNGSKIFGSCNGSEETGQRN